MIAISFTHAASDSYSTRRRLVTLTKKVRTDKPVRGIQQPSACGDNPSRGFTTRHPEILTPSMISSLAQRHVILQSRKSPLESKSMQHYPLAPRPLSDGLVGLVRPRAPAGRHLAERVRPFEAPTTSESPRDAFKVAGDAPQALLALIAARPKPFLRAEREMHPPVHQVDSSPLNDSLKRKRVENKQLRRREQCRANQARYRDKQRHAQLQLEKSVEQLHKELDTLKRRYRDLSSRERSNQSPWSIVAEVFRLLGSCFKSQWRMTGMKEMKNHTETRQILAVLERAFAHNAALGDLNGIEALMDQLRRYAQYFGDAQLHLKRIESVAPGVMSASARLSVTVTELTLRHIFPHLEGSDGGDYEQRLHQQLLGQRLHLNCSMNFLFDENSDRVVRLETKIDLAASLFRVLGNLKDVADVIEHAQVSPECILGNPHKIAVDNNTT
ncbi:unnamed protein product [Phytophthora lilii]|uniref:Unnamed protein product n=1 Tax=Phytophthora lilii TaxID=2077276 RepID=A0A9W6UE13_9STRA|nr:unnamed protein product [Phytophthora lilii]